MSIDFFTQLSQFPQDELSRLIWFEQMKVLLNNLDTQVNASMIDTVTLSQASLPSQANWETAYTSQTGKALPIPPTARLLWWDTTNNRFGGVFGTLNNDDTVYARASANSKGANAILGSHLLNSAHTVDY